MSDPIRFEFDMTAFNAALDKLDGAARGEALGRTAHAIAFRIEGQAKINAAGTFIHTPPHDLIPSIQTQQPVVTGDRSAECDVNVGSIYGAIREFGGIIQATKGEYLTFRTEDGAWHRVPSVMHPAQPYLRPAVDDEADLQIVGEAALENEIRQAGIQ
jgi:hypothetical protein